MGVLLRNGKLILFSYLPPPRTARLFYVGSRYSLCQRFLGPPRSKTWNTLRRWTAYHPKSDGQTKSAEKVMEQCLRSFISCQQDDRPHWLPSAELSPNNHSLSSIKDSPFFFFFLPNYGYHPAMSIQPPKLIDKTTSTQRSRLQIEDADKYADKER